MPAANTLTDLADSPQKAAFQSGFFYGFVEMGKVKIDQSH
jgi:hypothetical protein